MVSLSLLLSFVVALLGLASLPLLLYIFLSGALAIPPSIVAGLELLADWVVALVW